MRCVHYATITLDLRALIGDDGCPPFGFLRQPARIVLTIVAATIRRRLSIAGHDRVWPAYCVDMDLKRLSLADVVEIIPNRRHDDRGYFSEIFRRDWFAGNICKVEFVQENQSLSRCAGVVRGLHFQCPPFAQGKLVRCVAGAIFDVAVDIRYGSPTYGQWASATLTAGEANQLWIPPGFLHGFCTLVADSIVAYKVTEYYNFQSDKGVRWDDPDIAVAWPDIANPASLSDKDVHQPNLRDLPTYFCYATRER